MMLRNTDYSGLANKMLTMTPRTPLREGLTKSMQELGQLVNHGLGI
jgi:hypothetical protein